MRGFRIVFTISHVGDVVGMFASVISQSVYGFGFRFRIRIRLVLQLAFIVLW